VTERTAAPEPIWAFTEHEHRELARGIDLLHEIACGIETWAPPTLPARLGRILGWFDSVLDPHLRWEEASLYPEIDSRTGTPWATRSARFDHQQIREAATQVRGDRSRLLLDSQAFAAAETRCHLFVLEALLRSHIEREERFLVPIVAEPAAPRVPEPEAAPVEEAVPSSLDEPIPAGFA